MQEDNSVIGPYFGSCIFVMRDSAIARLSAGVALTASLQGFPKAKTEGVAPGLNLARRHSPAPTGRVESSSRKWSLQTEVFFVTRKWGPSSRLTAMIHRLRKSGLSRKFMRETQLRAIYQSVCEHWHTAVVMARHYQDALTTEGQLLSDLTFPQSFFSEHSTFMRVSHTVACFTYGRIYGYHFPCPSTHPDTY